VDETHANVHHLADVVLGHYGEETKVGGMDVRFHREQQLTGTAGGVKNVAEAFEETFVVVVVGDALAQQGEGSVAAPGSSGETAGPIDSIFIHRATSENISSNSTYLNNRLINGNPDVILSVTQNWNPQAGSGRYNDHSVGVWYDPGRKRWAIFNQDRAPMPERAAFNVVVAATPTGTR
jgi:hypothetical protein